MPVNELALFYRKSHEGTYKAFADSCEGGSLGTLILKPYPLDLTSAIRSLQTAEAELAVLECSLPMAMAIVNRSDEFRIVAFLDVARIRKLGSSASVYYHLSAEDKRGAILDLLAPSLFSMTTVSGAIYVNKVLGHRISEFKTFGDSDADPYDKIIESVGTAARHGSDLCRCAWVIDEASDKQMRHQKLVAALGTRFTEIKRKDVFQEMFDLYRQSAETFGHKIPGMFLIASHRSLRNPRSAGMMAALLDHWTKFRESDPDFHGGKSMGPFRWDDLSSFRNLIDLSAMIAKEADLRLQIGKPLQVYTNFFDVSLSRMDVDSMQRKQALRNFSCLLHRELTRLHSVAEVLDAELDVSARIIGDEVQRALENANESDSISKRLEEDAVPNDLSDLQSQVLSICREARQVQETLAETLFRMPDQIRNATVALHRTTVERTRLDEEL